MTECGAPQWRRSRHAVTAGWLATMALLSLLAGAHPAGAQHEDELEAPATATEMADQGPPYRVGGDVTPPLKLSGDGPVYTEEARLERVQGVAILETVIDETGSVTGIRMLKGLPFGLDRAAVEAVKTWKFEPATRQGVPVPVYFIVTVNFRVGEDAEPSGWFEAFLRDHHELSDLLAVRRFERASELLAGWAAEQGDSGVADEAHRAARAYALLEKHELRSAWLEVEALGGPEVIGLLHSLGDLALNRVTLDRSADAAARAEAFEVGLAATARAIERWEHDQGALLCRGRLLREKAEVATGAEREGLLAESTALQARGEDAGTTWP